MDKGIIVVKVGTSTLTDSAGKLDVAYIDMLTEQICQLKAMGFKVILVTSGAIGAGMQVINLSQRPTTKELLKLQACAAIGQGRLMRIYEESFSKHGTHAAQILLTQEDFSTSKRASMAMRTIMTLLDDFDAVPVINENDTVATEEIKFGDNDKLSALVTSLIGAHTLIILTDVDGLYSEENKIIPLVAHISRDIEKMARPSKGSLGIGGMSSKIEAAKIAIHSGATCIIANGRGQNALLRIADKESIGTTFLPSKIKTNIKKRWLAFLPRPKGHLKIDDGAKTALVSGNKSLLAAGIRSVSGDFHSGDVVSILSLDGEEVAKGVVGFSSDELNLIKGLKTSQIEERLGRKITSNEVVHRDNLVLI